MATLEDELKDLKEKNNELAQKVQYWKMTAAQRDDEKLALMKEINELRLKLSRLRNNGGFQARKLDAALQAASEKAISHLVKASAEIAKGMEIAKAYMRDRQELDAQSPRWSSIGGTPKTEKSERVHRVPPMMMGGQSIQPVVALSRTILNTSNPRVASRSQNQSQNRSLTERAVPMHMLQDVYIPLTRIDISDLPNNHMETETNNADDSVEDLGLEDDAERSEESDGHISEEDEFDTRKLHAVSEEETEVEEIQPTRLRLHSNPRFEYQDSHRSSEPAPAEPPDNPLEGPSWLLDDTPTGSKSAGPKSRRNLEPDSTTELDLSGRKTPRTTSSQNTDDTEPESSPGAARAFSPTVRRRKRTSSPPPLATPHQPHYSPRRNSNRPGRSSSGRVLQVLVSKLRLGGAGLPGTPGSPGSLGSPGGAGSPAKRARAPASLLSFDAPSPNGATDSRVIVSETQTTEEDRKSEQGDHASRRAEGQQRGRLPSQDTRPAEHEPRLLDSRESSRRSRLLSDSRDSDSGGDAGGGGGGAGDSVGEGRVRRNRRPVTYKEKPLNRKMRR